jgi:uncharacterized protein with von Willebrand factor type A (vWA) domain
VSDDVPNKRELSSDHREALLTGRTEARVVRDYLRAIRQQGPKKPGRKRTSETVSRRLKEVQAALANADAIEDPLKLLELTQEELDLKKELDQLQSNDMLPELEARFVEVVASFSERKRISYTTWRRLGVPASVLRRAGLRRDAA